MTKEEQVLQEESSEKPQAPPTPARNFAFDAIGTWLRKVHFRHQVFGGVNEVDVWQKIEELNNLYEATLMAERARYDTLLRLLSEKAGEEE